MKLLLIVGSANDIFIYNMAKWLKASMDVTIDVFEFYPTKAQTNDNQYFNLVSSPKQNVWHKKIKGIRGLIQPFFGAKALERFLVGKKYDIIQCHCILSEVVLTKGIKNHCKNLCYMFWGGELDILTLFYSHKYYLSKLRKSLNEVDYIINSSHFNQIIQRKYGYTNLKYFSASLGSSSMEYLYNICENSSKNDSKLFWNIPRDKKCILIGYSGKTAHNHLLIINELSKHSELKNKIHLLAPMTRGATDTYIAKVENALNKSGFTFTLIKGRFLSDQEIGRLRNATDIVLQMSICDGFSRSIVECMSAANIMIYGDWLDYDTALNKDKFIAYKVNSISASIEKLKDILADFENYYKIAKNHSINGKRYLWSECIKDWVNIYQSIC